jgi:hypothetical protein
MSFAPFFSFSQLTVSKDNNSKMVRVRKPAQVAQNAEDQRNRRAKKAAIRVKEKKKKQRRAQMQRIRREKDKAAKNQDSV